MRRAVIAACLALAMPVIAQPMNPPTPTVDDLVERLMRGVRMPDASKPTPPERARVASGTTAPPGVRAAALNVLFATGSAELTPAAERTLEILALALSTPQLAGDRFRIEGHTDTVGTAAMNLVLSERRAAAVRVHLTTRHRIDPARLQTAGLGESQLLVPTPDQVQEALNRRVQVINLGG